MRPKTLTLCGWGPYKTVEKVEFSAFEEKGIFLITGPTGAGKTTVFDAISYALYGALSGSERDKERGSVRSDFADTDTPTYVELVMEHGGKEYRIRRNPEYLRPKKRSGGSESFTKEKENAVLTFPDGRILEGVKEVNAALKELLVLDYQQFKKISMIAQGEFARLLVAPPKEKTQIFREIFDTGLYEKFTQELGVRSRAAYAAVMEQQHKLEEDVRLLSVGMEKSGWPEEVCTRFQELIDAQNWNYDNLSLCLKEMEKLAEENFENSRKYYEKSDKRIEKLSAELAGLEEANRRIAQLLRAEKEYEDLVRETPAYENLQERYNCAMNACWVESAEEIIRQQERRMAENRKEQGILLHDAEELEKNLKKGQKDYLEQEKVFTGAKAACEAAEHRRRLDAIGLAAELLEEGKPCPVCGSVHHPAPAAVSEEMVSEAELKQLKKERERQEKELLRLHGNTVSTKTRLDAAREQQSKLEEAQKMLETEREEAEEAFRKTLQEYGFPDRNAYLAVKMDVQDRERLGKKLEDYKAKKAAAEELYHHLCENVSDRTPIDLTEKEEALSREKGEKEEALKNQRLWERHLVEVRKTENLMAEKLECMAESKREYGYVKDLENLATGNNAAKLVFEQYVLAGYFEEILRAANLRFSGMTGGRYEMSRVPQVGDGRVKDNLEIQVLDYYTGKYRSVRTLSGGESFKASLALALGMSDVIQSVNGGICVDTLFVDEGFGALDEESLDQACDTLMRLVEKKHMIGIISHVAELRERIENQIVIEKSGSGSRIRCKVS